jgi:hypothetical protein
MARGPLEPPARIVREILGVRYVVIWASAGDIYRNGATPSAASPTETGILMWGETAGNMKFRKTRMFGRNAAMEANGNGKVRRTTADSKKIGSNLRGKPANIQNRAGRNHPMRSHETRVEDVFRGSIVPIENTRRHPSAWVSHHSTVLPTAAGSQ